MTYKITEELLPDYSFDKNGPICVNCENCQQAGSNRYICVVDSRRSWNPVTGMEHVDKACLVARMELDDCGPKARWFKPKGKKPLKFPERDKL